MVCIRLVLSAETEASPLGMSNLSSAFVCLCKAPEGGDHRHQMTAHKSHRGNIKR